MSMFQSGTFEKEMKEAEAVGVKWVWTSGGGGRPKNGGRGAQIFFAQSLAKLPVPQPLTEQMNQCQGGNRTIFLELWTAVSSTGLSLLSLGVCVLGAPLSMAAMKAWEKNQNQSSGSPCGLGLGGCDVTPKRPGWAPCSGERTKFLVTATVGNPCAQSQHRPGCLPGEEQVPQSHSTEQ